MDNILVPNTDLKSGYIRYRTEIDTAIQRVLESGWYILGKDVNRFEENFAAWCGVSHCVGVANGTDAIVVALRALGIGKGDAVFTVSHTAVATVAAIELTGAEVVLVDIEPGYFTINPQHLEDAIIAHSRAGGSTPKAVIGVHLYGNAFDIAAVRAICDRRNLRMIEDCAQAHGATYHGCRLGSFGDVATFSFYPTKNLGAFGDGGAIITNDAKIAKDAAAIRQYGWHERYLSDVRGLNSRLDELQAAILDVKLCHLDDEIASRRASAAIYNIALADVVTTPAIRDDAEHAYHLYVIRSPARDALAAALKVRGIGTGIHYPVPIHLQKAYAGRVKSAPAGLGETERAAREVLSLPMHPFLSKDDTDAVIAAVRADVQEIETR